MATRAENSGSESNCVSRSPDAAHPTKYEQRSLVDNFDAACAATPFPSHSAVADPCIPAEQHAHLVRNSDGIVLLAPRATSHITQQSRPVIAAALQSALHLAAGSPPPPPPARDSAIIISSDSTESQPPNCDDSAPHDGLTDVLSNTPPSASKKQNESFFALLGKPPFVPMEDLKTFTWDKSLSKKVLEEVVEEARRMKGASMSASTSGGARPSPWGVGSLSELVSPPKEPVDTVVLFAQQEAAASTMLRDLRAAHVKLRKLASSFRPGEAPVWALIAQRDGKLKPEAAAEMARARVAAAAAAAVMREAAEAERAAAASSMSSLDTDLTSSSHPTFLATSASASAASPLKYGSPSGGLARDFSNLTVSPSSKFANSSSVPILSHSRYPHLLHPPHHLSNANAKPLQKKRVSFAEGTIFHQKR